MIRMPLATASLLAIAISLAGCGEGKARPPLPRRQRQLPALPLQRLPLPPAGLTGCRQGGRRALPGHRIRGIQRLRVHC